MRHGRAVIDDRRGGAAVGIAVLTVLICIWLWPAGAAAQGGPDELSAKAQSYYRQGQRHYNEGEYEKAAEKLRKAYALTPMPLLLYNICLAEWRAGNLEEATAMAMRARGETLPKALRVKVDARLAAFEPIRSAREIAGRLAGDGVGGATGASAPRNVEGELAEPAGPSGASGASRFGGIGWLGIGSATLGAAGLTLAGVFDSRVADAVERMNRANRRGREEKVERIRNNEIEPRKRAGLIFLYTGAGLAATGVTLIIWDLATVPDTAGQDATATGTRLWPTVGVGRVGVQVEF